MDYFQYHQDKLYAEQVPLSDIAEAVGTPSYVYSRATLERHWHAFDDAFADYPHQICYAVKANGNLALLNILARLGSGFDIVSGGELARVVAAGGDPSRTIFSGVCKQAWEIRQALEAGIGCFNIESEGELQQISAAARDLGVTAAVSVRINPDVDPKTHPYISTGLRENKFGLSVEQAEQIYQLAAEDPHIRIHGVACHIGSQLTDLSPYRDALSRVLHFIDSLQSMGIAIHQIDFGGGLGVRYSDETPPSPEQYWQVIHHELAKLKQPIPVAIEPGRAISGNAGVLLTRVHYLKHSEHNRFCVVDAGMNDLIRPALYQAYQEIVEVDRREAGARQNYDVVGPVCESADFLGKQRLLSVAAGDLLAVRTSGAYGSVMSSNYNSRPRPAEVMVDGDRFQVIRPRESLQDLFATESMLPT